MALLLLLWRSIEYNVKDVRVAILLSENKHMFVYLNLVYTYTYVGYHIVLMSNILGTCQINDTYENYIYMSVLLWLKIINIVENIILVFQ